MTMKDNLLKYTSQNGAGCSWFLL